jgi:hypothetical protein
MKKLTLLFLLICNLGFCWEKFHSIEGNCEILFPNKPHHLKQVVPIKETNEYLNYDVYLSLNDSDTICMMVIANFPSKISPGDEKLSLEGFLNGVINHKNDKKVIYANFSNFYDLSALDFLLENQTRSFKGKVFIKEDKLYLIAIEYNNNLNLDQTFKKYIDSFILQK